MDTEFERMAEEHGKRGTTRTCEASEEKRMAIKLGEVYTDSITGFTGVAVGRTEFMFGCVRVSLQPKELREGKPIDAQVFDEQQLEGVVSASPKGGPGDPLPRRDAPRQ